MVLDVVGELHATDPERQRFLIGPTNDGDRVARWLVGTVEAQHRTGGSVKAIDQQPTVRERSRVLRLVAMGLMIPVLRVHGLSLRRCTAAEKISVSLGNIRMGRFAEGRPKQCAQAARIL